MKSDEYFKNNMLLNNGQAVSYELKIGSSLSCSFEHVFELLFNDVYLTARDGYYGVFCNNILYEISAECVIGIKLCGYENLCHLMQDGCNTLYQALSYDMIRYYIKDVKVEKGRVLC